MGQKKVYFSRALILNWISWKFNLFLLIHFSDPYRSKLRRLDLKNTNITNSGFNHLVKHNLRELRMHNCLYLTDDILSELNSHSHNLVELSIEPAAGVLPAYLPSLKGMIDKGSFTNYDEKILAFFDHLPPCVDIFYGIKVGKKWKILGPLPTSSSKPWKDVHV